jgi:hypothetical protein
MPTTTERRSTRERREETAEVVAVRRRIESASAARAVVMEQVADHTRNIAVMCQEAREMGINLKQLSEWVKIPDGDGGLRPVTRQAVDQMLVAHFGRPERDESAAIESSINASVFG